MAKLDQKVEQEAKNMNLSTVRLCFQTYIQNDQGHFVNALEPVYSHQIFDSSECRIHSCKNIRQFINFVVIVLQACYLDDNFIHKAGTAEEGGPGGLAPPNNFLVID